MTTAIMVRDEARRRIAALHGGTPGSDVTIKALNSVIRHIDTPTAESAYLMRCHLAILDASNKLEKTLPLDFAHDHNWPMPNKDVTAPAAPASTAGIEFNGHRFMPDRGQLALAVALASAAVVNGASHNEFRWHMGRADFAMIAVDGTSVPMDAPDVIAFGFKALNA